MVLNRLRSIWAPEAHPLGGRYQIIENLGMGGFGQTFTAQDLHLPGHPLCVIKQLKPQVTSDRELQIAQRLFDTEAKTLYRLGSHPQIPRLLAHFTDRQEFYLAQELIEGDSWADVLESQPTWQPSEIIAVLGDILGTLAFVHENRVIHRDLKPSNMIRRHQDGRIVLIDFGAVKQASTQISASNTDMTHTVSIGTQGYMPSEQLAGTPYFSSDMYAVGMIAIQALTGQHPRTLSTNPHSGEIRWHHYASEAPPELIAILDRMVKYDFRARYSTATEALEALQALPPSLSQFIPTPLPFHQIPSRDSASPKIEADVASVSIQLPVTHSDSGQNIPPTQSGNHSELESPEHSSDESDGGNIPSSGQYLHQSIAQTLPVLGAYPQQGQEQIQRNNQSNQVTRHVTLRSHQSSLNDKTIKISPFRRSPLAIAITGMGLSAALGVGVFVWRTMTPLAETLSSSANPSLENGLADDGLTGADGQVAGNITEVVQQSSVMQHLQKAQSFRDASQYDQSLTVYDEAIALDGNSSEAHQGRCYSLNRLGRYEEAIQACDRAIALDGNNADAFVSKGYAFDLQAKHQDALALYEQALAINPDLAEAWSNKGTALLQLGKPQDAVAAFDRALAISSALPEAWNNRGAALWSLRQFDAALQSVEQAIALRPNYPDALSLRQTMRAHLGRD